MRRLKLAQYYIKYTRERLVEITSKKKQDFGVVFAPQVVYLTFLAEQLFSRSVGHHKYISDCVMTPFFSYK